MRETLVSEIAALEERETYWIGDIANIEQEQPINMTQLYAIQEELKQVQRKLAEKRSELAALDGAAEIAQAELFNEFENITIGDQTFTLRDMCQSEDHYQLLSQWLQIREGDKAQRQAAIEASYKSQIVALEDQVKELDEYRKLYIEQSDKLADMELRRNAAADELDNAQEEVKRLTADNTSLRAQLEATSKPAHTNLNGNLAEIAERIKSKLPLIYNKRWENVNHKTHYLATLAETGEEIRFGYLEAGKYREGTAEEAEKFRAELEAERAAEAQRLAEETLQHQALVVPTIPSEGTEYNVVDGESTEDGTMVTRQEFEALAARVSQLEQQKVNAA